MKLKSVNLLMVLILSALSVNAIEPEPISKVIWLDGMLVGKLNVEGISGMYYVDEEFPENCKIRITGREVYVSRVSLIQNSDSTLTVFVSLPSWLKAPSPADLEISVTGPALTSLAVSKGSNFNVQGFYSKPQSLTLTVKNKSCLLFNNPVGTSDITATVSSGSALTILHAQAQSMTLTIADNSTSLIGGASIISRLAIDASGRSTAYVAKSSVDVADFSASDMSHIGYNPKPRKLKKRDTRGSIIDLSNEIPESL